MGQFTKKPVPKRDGDSRYTQHYVIEGHTPTTDILDRIKKATPNKQVLVNVTVTPAMATDLMTINIGNRPVKLDDVHRWAKDMKNGKWLPIGGGLGFSTEMKMVDGQHRCLAIIESGIEQIFNIITGLPPEAFNVMDTGRQRTAGDILSISNFSNYTCMAAAIKSEIYYRLFGGFASNIWQGKIPNYAVVEWIENQTNTKLMQECTIYACTFLRRKGPFLQNSTWAFLYYILSKVHRGDATRFVTAFAAGEDISMSKDAPIYLLRQKMLSLTFKKNTREIQASATLVTKMHYIITAWNLWRQGKRPKELSINTAATEIPRPI